MGASDSWGLCLHVQSVMSDPLRLHGLQSPRLLCPWELPGKNTGVGCHFLLQRIFLTEDPISSLTGGSLPLACPGKPHHCTWLSIPGGRKGWC